MNLTPLLADRAPAPATGRLGVRLLGTFHVTLAGTTVTLAQGARRLLVFLALHPEWQDRGFVGGCLWPEKTDGRAAANLRSSLWRLRGPPHAPVVEQHQHQLRLSASVHVDLNEVMARGRELLRPSPPPVLPSQALFREDLLPGWYEDWIIVERERYDQLRLHFLEALVAHLVEAGRYADAVDTALRLVSSDPLRERSHVVLISALAREGNRIQALRHYQQLAELHRSVFGTAPATTFEDAIGCFGDPPAPRAPAGPATNRRTWCQLGAVGHATTGST